MPQCTASQHSPSPMSWCASRILWKKTWCVSVWWQWQAHLQPVLRSEPAGTKHAHKFQRDMMGWKTTTDDLQSSDPYFNWTICRYSRTRFRRIPTQNSSGPDWGAIYSGWLTQGTMWFPEAVACLKLCSLAAGLSGCTAEPALCGDTQYPSQDCCSRTRCVEGNYVEGSWPCTGLCSLPTVPALPLCWPCCLYICGQDQTGCSFLSCRTTDDRQRSASCTQLCSRAMPCVAHVRPGMAV